MASDPQPAPAPRAGLGGAVATLRLPHYGRLWTSNLVQHLCFQVAVLAMHWLVTELTSSRTVLGLVGFAQGVAMVLLLPAAGVLADRAPKRRLMLLGRLGMAGVALAVTALVASGQIAIWHLVVASLVGGGLAALISPASQTYVFDLVGRARLQSAVALNATAAGFAHMAGPALGGLLVALLGVTGAYASAGAGLLLSAGILLAIPVSGRSAAARPHTAWGELREGLAHVRGNPPLALTLLACSMALFNGCVVPMRPAFARFVLGVGSEGYGLLVAAGGVGTVLAAVAASVLPPMRHHGLAIAGSMLGFAVCVLLYAAAFSYGYLLAVEFAMGFVGELWAIWAFAGIQLSVPEALRGRIVSLVFLLAQLGFVGQLAVGALADAVGDRLALGLFGLIPTAVLSALLVFGWRTLRQLGSGPALSAGASPDP